MAATFTLSVLTPERSVFEGPVEYSVSWETRYVPRIASVMSEANATRLPNAGSSQNKLQNERGRLASMRWVTRA